MYCVVIGNLDTAVKNTDFSVFGPFDTEAAANTFTEEWFEAVGSDNDEAVVVQFLNPADELAQERKERAEAITAGKQ